MPLFQTEHPSCWLPSDLGFELTKCRLRPAFGPNSRRIQPVDQATSRRTPQARCPGSTARRVLSPQTAHSARNVLPPQSVPELHNPSHRTVPRTASLKHRPAGYQVWHWTSSDWPEPPMLQFPNGLVWRCCVLPRQYRPCCGLPLVVRPTADRTQTYQSSKVGIAPKAQSAPSR